ncbi:SDR family oxidoreductase [Parapedobacter koreensis]|uniref:NAD(P)-dependent dehydrogenase, short-chain alcohol dehydrogenase family n=1 Tax=Parapedobacter koreensis TaxID=332977 RepID=A0A1H7LM08_9SPHI|nr:SDR family oxidoreductase [Parapedobacter koreensis]SEK99926.1 NAD(P)-dependent dehydrogenase, short-chain alcohol dehydrogenase family [Parapedobacter koreensis]
MLTNKIALITGGNSGIGYATAEVLKAQGADVIITGRREQALQEAAASLGVKGYVADQSKLADIEQLAAQVKGDYGRVDILFINAGISKVFPIEGADESQLDEIMDINFKGAFFTLSRFIPLLPDGATVIFLSSIVAQFYGHSSSIYSASKAALNAVMKTAALELAPRKIRVNAVSPGPTKTEVMAKSGYPEEVLRQTREGLISRIPLHRMAEAEEIGKLVAFLASADNAAFITGSEFVIDGGITI